VTHNVQVKRCFTDLGRWLVRAGDCLRSGLSPGSAWPFPGPSPTARGTRYNV